ncbi:hypothetical protein M758_UG197700 [Ceratodon purpureus]|nr:hypothetical protein M758_UG197700 [Ceratodon purpureus]
MITSNPQLKETRLGSGLRQFPTVAYLMSPNLSGRNSDQRKVCLCKKHMWKQLRSSIVCAHRLFLTHYLVAISEFRTVITVSYIRNCAKRNFSLRIRTSIVVAHIPRLRV